MRFHTTILLFVLAGLLLSCDDTPHTTTGIDPGLGLQCFENHRASLPPGTQYEGIGKHAGNALTIKIMNGVEVVTLDCELNPDGSLQSTGK